MSHTDPVILALRALGDTSGTADDAGHAATCAHCRAELARLTEVVELARHEDPGERLETPPPQVWDRIAAAVGIDPVAPPGIGVAVSAGNGVALPVSRQPRARRRILARRPRGRLAAGLAGLAAGLIIGIGAAAGIVQLAKAPAPRLVAQIELSPLPEFPQWQHATGTAVMRATASQQQIAIILHAPRRLGFYEVWLLARNGVSMISLGDLNAGHTGTFTVPPGTDLRDYSRIDISLQPFNGSTQHSRTSVVRGSWPAAALVGGGSAPAR